MAMSGVEMKEECVDAYQAVKSNKLKCCAFRLSDDHKQIIKVEESQMKYHKRQTDPQQFKDFQQLFPADQCRYAVYHAILGLEGSDGIKSERDRIVFISWAPDTAKIKSKMLHSSSKDAIKKRFEGIGIEFQFSSQDELQACEWIGKFQELPNIKMAGTITEFEGLACKAWDDE